jgi:hypothetical protein
MKLHQGDFSITQPPRLFDDDVNACCVEFDGQSEGDWRTPSFSTRSVIARRRIGNHNRVSTRALQHLNRIQKFRQLEKQDTAHI